MMTGKNKCRILREIRRKIADENDIPFVTEECRYKGNCSGTCPKCESELEYLEKQLERRRSIGKAVTVSAVSLGLLTSAAGCHTVMQPLEGDVPYTPEETTFIVTEGSIAVTDETQTSRFDPSGNINEDVYGPPIDELEGDVLYTPEETEYSPDENIQECVYGPPEYFE